VQLHAALSLIPAVSPLFPKLHNAHADLFANPYDFLWLKAHLTYAETYLELSSSVAAIQSSRASLFRHIPE